MTSSDARLSTVDLIPDVPLRGTSKRPIADSEDLLRHRVIARKVAELATSASGKVNIALFGPSDRRAFAVARRWAGCFSICDYMTQDAVGIAACEANN